jgi:hypothetical protein
MYVIDTNGTTIYSSDEDEAEIINSLTLLKEINIPENITEGEYLLKIDAKYLHFYSSATAPFVVSKPIYLYTILGIPLWLMFLLISFFSFVLLNYYIYKSYKERKKRYRILVDYNTLPKPGDRVVKLGKIAETKTPAYYELDRLTTHCIVAGATGMGKSISAQVIIEEALMDNIAVIVFDPTAQWSGMLRKCTDKKMMSYYPKFGLKETDSRAFKGNVRQVKNARQKIEINKHMNPGQIQIFTLNKLDPKDIDMFVANVIRGIFNSDPKESPNLKLIIVFDEVHRLLSKFGGSGEGFLQVERACREFRKWGIGVMLISQVLSDFVGEIKANINTEVQTRTLEESDLERIKTKYGEGYLKSLVRAEVGVAMFQNAEYNRGRPYFINFRPILHNTRRLPDEELEKYNKYNDIVEDLEYQVEQLEKEKVDTFDLKMELKLVKDKIMTGSFSVVEIYLEGLRPRIAKEWEKLGKKPKKKQLQLVSEEEIKKSIEEAKKAHAKAEKQEAKQLAAQKPKVEKKQDINTKEVAALTFDNGVMVSSLKELKGVLPTMDSGIFKVHVNKKRNDIAKWVTENFGEQEGKKLEGVIDKNQVIKVLGEIGKAGVKAEEIVKKKEKIPEESPQPIKEEEPEKENKPQPVIKPTPQPKPQPQPIPKPVAKPQPIARPTPQPKPQPQPIPKSIARPAPQPIAKPTPQPKPQPQPIPKSIARPAPQPIAKPTPQPKPQPQPIPKPVAKPQPIARPTPQPKPQPQPQSKPIVGSTSLMQSLMRPLMKPKPTPKPIAKPTPQPKPQPQPIPKPVAKPQPIARPTPQPKPQPQPIPKSIAKPQPIAKPTPQPKPVVKPKPQPVVKPKPKPKPKPVVRPQPIVKPTPQSLPTKKPEKLLAEKGVLKQPITESVVKEVVKPLSETVAKQSVEPITELVTEKVSKPLTESITQEVVEPITESVTKEVSKPLAESITKEVSKPLAESITKEVVKPLKETVQKLTSAAKTKLETQPAPQPQPPPQQTSQPQPEIPLEFYKTKKEKKPLKKSKEDSLEDLI